MLRIENHITGMRSTLVADPAAEKRAEHDADQEGDEEELRRLHRTVELLDQIEGAIRAQARLIDGLEEQTVH